MKFFKHFVDAHRGQFLHLLYDEFGHLGISCYWTLLELCAEKLEKQRDESLSEEHCVFVFHEQYLRKNLRISSAKLQKFLRFCSTNSQLCLNFAEEKLEIKMPKLLEYMDRDARRPRPCAPKIKIKIEDKEEDKEKGEKEKSAPAKLDAPEVLLVIKTYCELWKSRNGKNPSIRGKDAGQLKRLAKDLGVTKACRLIEIYFQMPDPFFLKRGFDVATLVSSVAAIEQFESTGKVVTRKVIELAEERVDKIQGTAARSRRPLEEIEAERAKMLAEAYGEKK